MNFFSTDDDACKLPWNDIIGYGPPNAMVQSVLKKACAAQTKDCDDPDICGASTPVCSTCCEFVNKLPGSDEFKQAGNDYCRSLSQDADWAAECDTGGTKDDGSEITKCSAPIDGSDWKKEIAAIVLAKVEAKVEAKMKDLQEWKTKVGDCVLSSDGKCKTYATKEDNDDTTKKSNIAIALSLFCLLLLILFWFMKK